MGIVQTFKELKERAAKAGYPVWVGGGIAGFSGPLNREMAGDYVFENEKKERFIVVVQGRCDQCRQPLKGWENWYASKEEGTPLEAECSGNPPHLVPWDELGDAQLFEVLWEGPQTMGYFAQMTEVAKILKG